MSNDDTQSSDRKSRSQQNDGPSQRASAPQKRSLFDIPPPLKRIFDKFPLVTHEENTLPLRARTQRDANILYVFTTKEDARNGRPSFNPSCLKWQTFLKLAGISFKTVSSSNHASPSGALPFLLPSSTAGQAKPAEPVAGNKVKKWSSSQLAANKVQEPDNMQYEAYASLLENSIRKAWLFQLYLSPANSSVVHRLYVEPCSSNIFVQKTILYQLQRAAESELLKASTSGKISEAEILSEFEEAVDALATLLGQDEWFFVQPTATLFDASVFAYTHLILDDSMNWEENKLGQILGMRHNLVEHRNRILEMYY